MEAKAFAGEIKAELEKRGLLGEKLGLGGFDGGLGGADACQCCLELSFGPLDHCFGLQQFRLLQLELFNRDATFRKQGLRPCQPAARIIQLRMRLAALLFR